MADIRPFRAIRPKEGLEAEIAALPYDVYNREEAREAVQGKPLSFLNIDRAETQFAPDADMYGDFVYEKARDMLDQMIQAGQFVQDPESCYYIYELTMDGRSQTGIVACASVDDYVNQVIKKHENTRAEKEEDRIRHVDVCSAQTGPIFLAYRARKELTDIVNRIKRTNPLYDFTSEDGIRHRVWKISDPAVVDAVRDHFAKIQTIYIADGHHRCASAVKVGLKRRQAKPDYTGEEEFNYFLSVLFPDEELMIMDYNRVVKDLNGLSEEAFLERVKEKFHVECLGDNVIAPAHKGQVCMYLGGKWYRMEYEGDLTGRNPVEALDVSVLQNELLEPVLGIHDPKTDDRIDFVGGIRGLAELERRVRADCKVAFAMYPTSIQELFAVSDAGLLMPPKSTWFEPKLRSGIFIHRIERL